MEIRDILAFLPAVVALFLCLLLRRALIGLGLGVFVGVLITLILNDEPLTILQRTVDWRGLVFLVILLFGFASILGVWSANGGAAAFAEWISRRFVRGPISAKVAAWTLGVLFFQGGGLSALLVGTAIRPTADRHRVSHEELAYVVDSTSAPVAVAIPLNAWPFYIQSLIYVAGVGFLATEAERFSFFFQSVIFSFFAFLAILFALLFAVEKSPFAGKRLIAAKERARLKGALNAEDARPLGMDSFIPSGHQNADYKPNQRDFWVPIGGLLVGLMWLLWLGRVTWIPILAIFAALLGGWVSWSSGLSFNLIRKGVTKAWVGVAPVALLLCCALLLGGLGRELGMGTIVAGMFENRVVFWVLPAVVFAMTAVIGLMTGTSWGTFAIALPIVMPVAIGMAAAFPPDAGRIFVMLALAAAVNGGILGDLCSPLSDTSILSSMATGCDLIDHVRTQWLPSIWAAGFALLGWTLVALSLGWMS